MKLWEFLRGETDLRPLRFVGMAAIAGLSNALLLAMINQATERAHEHQRGNLLPFTGFVLVLVLYIISQRSIMRVSNTEIERVIGRLRIRLADKLRKADVLAVEALGQEQIYGAVTRDTQIVSQAATPIMVGIHSAILIVFTALYIAQLDIRAFLVTLGVVSMAVMIHLHKRVELMQDLQQSTDRENEFFGTLTHLLDGFKEVRMSTRRSDELYADLTAIAQSAVNLKTRTGLTLTDHYVFSQTAFYILLAALVFVLPSYFSTLPGSITQITAAVLFIVGPLSSLISIVPMISGLNVAVDNITRIESVLDRMEHEAKDRDETSSDPPPAFEGIQFDGVVFAYRDARGSPTFEIGPIDFAIRRREILFIVGGNGSGKSTFLKVLAALYYPDAGRITLDGQEVSAIGYTRYRNLFSPIFSDYHLFDRIYGVDYQDDDVNQKLRDMELGNKTKFADGRFLNQDLSTGQRKRLALIVSLLEDHQIYVFDEWAADQDPLFRERFYRIILPSLVKHGKTVIAATHDDRYFNIADRVLKMENGRFAELQT